MISTLLCLSVLLLIAQADAYRTVDYPKPHEYTESHWLHTNQEVLKSKLDQQINEKHAKNAIFFIGDGMGEPIITAYRTYRGQQEDLPSEHAPLSFEKFPVTGFQKTHSLTHHVTDSGSSASAMLNGLKTRQRSMGISPAAPTDQLFDCNTHTKFAVESLADWAIKEGKSVGLVTTSYLTDATPAALYANALNRRIRTDAEMETYRDMISNFENCKDIARQLVENKPGTQLKVIFGGGRSSFHKKTDVDIELGSEGEQVFGRRLSGNLTDDWLKLPGKRQYIWNRDQLLQLATDQADHVMGLFAHDYMDFALRYQRTNRTDNPTLAEMTRVAIEILATNPNGYFLLVEGAAIDIMEHYNYPKMAFYEMAELDAAVEMTRRTVNVDETLIVVTGDHSHPLKLVGYAPRTTPVLGKWEPSFWSEGSDGMPSTYLVFLVGQAALRRQDPHNTTRRNLTLVDTGCRFPHTQPDQSAPACLEADEFYAPSFLPMEKSFHAGEDIAVYAEGPSAHVFGGAYDNTYIAHALAYALCVGPAKDRCIQNEKHGFNRRAAAAAEPMKAVKIHDLTHLKRLAVASLLLLLCCAILFILIGIAAIQRDRLVSKGPTKASPVHLTQWQSSRNEFVYE